MPREDFGIVADLILQAVKSSSENDVTSPEGVEEFLDEAMIKGANSNVSGFSLSLPLLTAIKRTLFRLKISIALPTWR